MLATSSGEARLVEKALSPLRSFAVSRMRASVIQTHEVCLGECERVFLLWVNRQIPKVSCPSLAKNCRRRPSLTNLGSRVVVQEQCFLLLSYLREGRQVCCRTTPPIKVDWSCFASQMTARLLGWFPILNLCLIQIQDLILRYSPWAMLLWVLLGTRSFGRLGTVRGGRHGCCLAKHLRRQIASGKEEKRVPGLGSSCVGRSWTLLGYKMPRFQSPRLKHVSLGSCLRQKFSQLLKTRSRQES